MLGIFDSGVGGLTVVKELLARYPRASFVYLGDTARTPYGNKSPETIVRYALEDAAFLISKGADTIVLACNTASSCAVGSLREAHPAITVFDVIQPAVEAAAASGRTRIGVIGTKATVASGVYETRLHEAKQDMTVFSVACPLFVPLVEEGWIARPETVSIARAYLEPLLEKRIDALILGCTHYPLLMDIIRPIVGEGIAIIDSPSALLDRMEQAITVPEGGMQQLYFTDQNDYARYFRDWFGTTFSPELAKLSPIADEG